MTQQLTIKQLTKQLNHQATLIKTLQDQVNSLTSLLLSNKIQSEPACSSNNENLQSQSQIETPLQPKQPQQSQSQSQTQQVPTPSTASKKSTSITIYSINDISTSFVKTLLDDFGHVIDHWYIPDNKKNTLNLIIRNSELQNQLLYYLNSSSDNQYFASPMLFSPSQNTLITKDASLAKIKTHICFVLRQKKCIINQMSLTFNPKEKMYKLRIETDTKASFNQFIENGFEPVIRKKGNPMATCNFPESASEQSIKEAVNELCQMNNIQFDSSHLFIKKKNKDTYSYQIVEYLLNNTNELATLTSSSFIYEIERKPIAKQFKTIIQKT